MGNAPLQGSVFVNPNTSTENHTDEKVRADRELTIQREIAFASGLFQEDEMIRTFLESLAEAVIVVDTRRIILLVNSRAESMFGYDKNEIVGKPHDILLPDRLRTIHERHMSDYYKEPKIRPMGMGGLDLWGRRRDGSEFPAEISLSFVETMQGRFVLAFVSDITLRKEAEKALSDRANELEAANKELDSFSYSVSHDLRNPLQAMVGLGEVLGEEFSDQLGAKGMELVRRIMENGAKMNALIEDILNLSKVTRKEMVFEEINIGRIAESVIADLRKAEPKRDIHTRVEATCAMRADPNLMKIVLNNLIGNAWKFTRRTEGPRIEFGCMRKGGAVVFFVRDNGVGFDMGQSEKLFVPFKRLHSEKDYPGTGIGLATVARIIRRHGGRIWAESEPGQGATFFFTL